MDKETLTNHISNLGKHYFDNACRIVLRDIFHLRAINVDGSNDGGTDYAQIDSIGQRTPVAYQITTQKSDIKGKAYRDAKKAIDKLGVERYYFLSTYILEETELRVLESKIQSELSIQSICLDASSIAGLILSENLLNKFLDESNYPLPIQSGVGSYDYREMALHSYTLLSEDSKKLKEGIYDDTILYILSSRLTLSNEEIIDEVIKMLSLQGDKEHLITNRIGALFGQQKLQKDASGKVELSEKARLDLLSRKTIYERELSNLLSAQIDLFREHGVDWNVEDSKKISVWIANAFISEEFKNLKEVKASIIAHPIFQNLEVDGVDKINKYLIKTKKIQSNKTQKIVEDLLKLASNHPLITKITRASMYLALQGENPISAAKALGAARWSHFSILVEPTVAIPYLCSILYHGKINRYFDSAINSIKRAEELDSKLWIPFFYINECAGHLLHARKYNGIDLDEKELQYSSNAFVANYYALKQHGARLPSDFMDYLCSFSPSLKIEKYDRKNWVRAIMTDIQSILSRSNIEFIKTPFYQGEDCKNFEISYSSHLESLKVKKKKNLIDHDVWALQFSNDSIVEKGEHWIILTYDTSLITFGKTNDYKGWITSPINYLDLSATSKSLSETQFISLLHTVASYSERTLSIGARIMDRIILFASKEMQNWEFKQEIESFKKELISNIDLYPNQFQIDIKTDEFLESRGISLRIEEEESVDE